MRALVISGGGSKGAFAGGVAQFLIEELGHKYDIFVGSSTGSLLISHLALNKVEKIKRIYTSVNESSIFNRCPFLIKSGPNGNKQIKINHYNVIRQFLRGKKTFGESKNLRRLIAKEFTKEEFETLKSSDKEVIVTVSNLTYDRVEYKPLKYFTYEEYCDWVWISCNFIPFMSIAIKDNSEYGDGGFGNMVPIEEAIFHGATTIDVIALLTEVTHEVHPISKNAFSLLSNLNLFITGRISRQNIRIGKLIAAKNNVKLNFYYTPSKLTSNSLIFDQETMTRWWQLGRDYARERTIKLNQNDNNNSDLF